MRALCTVHRMALHAAESTICACSLIEGVGVHVLRAHTHLVGFARAPQLQQMHIVSRRALCSRCTWSTVPNKPPPPSISRSLSLARALSLALSRSLARANRGGGKIVYDLLDWQPLSALQGRVCKLRDLPTSAKIRSVNTC
jgi:hypothetical protein